jgi:hypothetical protein
MLVTEVEARTIVGEIATRRREELRSALGQLRGSLEINLSVWSGPEHIPIELLQNADDAFENGATDDETRGSMFYITGEKFLLVAHDGPPFTVEDVDYISSIGRPHKKPGRQSGWMDFGFKSVFQLTNHPMIFSGPFRFGFVYDRATGKPESILIPRWIDQVPSEAKDLYEKGYTVFYLPLRTDVAELGQFCQAIDFAPLSLAFLRHIRRITLQTEHRQKQYNVEPVRGGIHTVVETCNGEVYHHLFKLFSKPVQMPPNMRSQDRVIRSGRGSVKNATVSLAIHLDEEHNLVPTEGQLYYFVPTTIGTGLKFDINGDFLLNAERTAIDRSLRWNEHLLMATADLVAEAMDAFRKHRRWRYQFYELLPTGQENALEIVERTIIQTVRSYCQTHPIIISHQNAWLLPSKVAIAPRRLQRVLESSGIGLDGYLNAKATGVNFIKSLDVVDFTGDKEGELVKQFVETNAARMSGMPIKWFLKFYSYLGEAIFADNHNLRMNQWYLWQRRIRDLPIVLTESGNVRPQDAVFPTRSQEVPKSIAKRLKFVHPGVVSGRGVRRVLVDGFQTPVFSPASVVESIAREAEEGTSRRWSKKDRREVLYFVHRWLRRRRWEIPPDLRGRLPHLLVPTTKDWMPAKDAYLHFEALRELLPEAPVANVLGSSAGDTMADWERTFRALGVVDFPKVQSIEGAFTHRVSDAVPADVQPNWNRYWAWLGKKEINLYEYTSYQRLTSIHWAPWLSKLPTLRPRTRREALQVILRAWGSYYSSFVEIAYEWFYRTDYRKRVSSYFSYQLRNEEWLPTTIGPMKPGPSVFAPLRQVRSLLGDLVPYIECDDFDAKNARTFLEHIGVNTELDIEALVSALAFLGSRNPAPEYWTDQRLAHLKELYRSLAQQIDQDQLPASAVVLMLLRADRQFANTSSLVWNDDIQIGQLFPDFNAYAWVPPMERPLLQRLFLIAGVRPLSTLVVSSTVGDSSWDAVAWVARFRAKASFLYSLVVHHQPEVAGDLLHFLNEEPRVVGHSDLRLKLIWDAESRLVPVPAYFEREEVTLHLASCATASDVAFALAKGLGLPEQTEQVERILIEDQADLGRRFERWGVAVVSIPDETIMPEEPEPNAEEAVPSGAVENEGLKRVTTEGVVGGDVVTDDKQGVRSIAREGLQDSGTSPTARLPITTASPGSRRSHIPSVITGERPADMKARKQAELEAMYVSTWFEKSVRGREVRDVSQRESYDLESIDPANPGIVDRHIEVKAHFSSWPVELTDPEKEQARVLGSDYWIYVVTKTETGYKLYPIQNPIDCTQVDIQEHFTTIWRVIGWEATQPITAPPEAGLHNR